MSEHDPGMTPAAPNPSSRNNAVVVAVLAIMAVVVVVAALVAIGLTTKSTNNAGGIMVPPGEPPTSVPVSGPTATPPSSPTGPPTSEPAGAPRLGSDALIGARLLPVSTPSNGPWVAQPVTTVAAAFAASCGPSDALTATGGPLTAYERSFHSDGDQPGAYQFAAQALLQDGDEPAATDRYQALLPHFGTCSAEGDNAAGSEAGRWTLRGAGDQGTLLRLQVADGAGATRTTTYLAIVRTSTVTTLLQLRLATPPNATEDLTPVTTLVHDALTRLCGKTGLSCPAAKVEAIPLPG